MKSIIANKTVLVTGGAGFIGANLIRRLLKTGYNINLIVRKNTDLWRLENIVSKIRVYKIDLLDSLRLSKTVSKIKPDIIIHLATYSNYRNQQAIKQMINLNIQGTLNLLMASKDIDYAIFINTGSSSEYGFKNKPMNEKDLLEPISFYAATKASATLLCQVFAREYKKPIVTLRPFSVYGQYEEKDRFIPTIIKAAIEDKSINLTPGKQRRDFIYIKDVVDMYIKTLSYGKKLSGQILNMGTGIEYTNDEVIKMLFQITEKKVKIEKGAYPTRIWDTQHWVADISKTKTLLKWKPKFSLEKGLEETYKWYLKLYEK
ncbi:MAG: SDR family NAD(P)-dependent oxidoreductase [Candidatus Levybacteria bacterium]|nr:SDR family NAD(P)-dependent oxidoreductase [Candidatus Levybacteria bacterium]